jgi:hypothetical protein
MAKGIPISLQQVAKAWRTSAAKLAPYDTGNLSRKIKSYNTPARMIKWNSKTMDAKINLVFDPPGAEYGKFWNKPPATSKSRVKHRPEFNFANKAGKSSEVKIALKQLSKELGKMVASDIKKELKTK